MMPQLFPHIFFPHPKLHLYNFSEKNCEHLQSSPRFPCKISEIHQVNRYPESSPESNVRELHNTCESKTEDLVQPMGYSLYAVPPSLKEQALQSPFVGWNSNSLAQILDQTLYQRRKVLSSYRFWDKVMGCNVTEFSIGTWFWRWGNYVRFYGNMN